MNKTILISVVVILAIAAIVVFLFIGRKKEGVPSPVSQPSPAAEVLPEDSTASINQAIEETETIDLDKEFKDIDTDLQSL